jgi:hypothetical protein
MPTAAHESAVSKLHDHPALLSKLVRKVFHAALDPHLKPIDATLRFANPQEVRPDLVFLGRRPRWLIVELQNSTDPAKRRRWLLAASMLFNDHGEMGDVLVITASRRVARWAARVATARGALGTGLELRPKVLLLAGRTLQALLDPRHPELSFFAAWAMQDRHGPQAQATVRRALKLTEKLRGSLQAKQLHAILNVLNRRMVTFAREVLMNPDETKESPWFRKFRLELEAKGEARGEAKGKAEGKAEGKQEALLVLLSTRELPVSSSQKKQIAACTDLEVLDTWIRRGASADSVAEVLAPVARSPRRATAKPARSTAPRRATRA